MMEANRIKTDKFPGFSIFVIRGLNKSSPFRMLFFNAEKKGNFMNGSHPEFEVRFRGRTFLEVRDGQVDVHGADYNADLADVSRLIAILSDVLCSAAQMKDEGSGRAPAQPEKTHDNVIYLGVSGGNRRKTFLSG